MTGGTRTYGVATPEQIAGKTGLELLHAVIAGELPAPTMFRHLDVWMSEASEGRVVCEGETSGEILNPAGTVHGGWALTMVDSACGCACQSLLPPGAGFTTIETKTNFVRPILTTTGRVRAEANIIGRGRQVMSAECRITAANGRVLAHGTSTLLVIPARS